MLGHLVQQRTVDRDTIILVFYNIKTIVSEYWDGTRKDDEKWRHGLIHKILTTHIMN